MEPSILLSDKISLIDYELIRYKFVLEHFPDVSLNDKKFKPEFSSKSVNSNYNSWKFDDSFHLSMSLFHDLEFNYGNKSEIIRVASIPYTTKIAYPIAKNGSTEIQFRKPKCKLNKKLQNDLHLAISKYISDHPIWKINSENLDKRIKQLLFLM